MSLLSAAILLFFVMDPVGNIPLFLAAVQPVPPERRLWVVGRELLIAYGLLIAFLFAGRPLLSLLCISEPALTIAGGIVLFLIALKMVFPAAAGTFEEEIDGELEQIRLEASPDAVAIDEIEIPAKKTDITVDDVVLAWVPEAPVATGMQAERSPWA